MRQNGITSSGNVTKEGWRLPNRLHLLLTSNQIISESQAVSFNLFLKPPLIVMDNLQEKDWPSLKPVNNVKCDSVKDKKCYY